MSRIGKKAVAIPSGVTVTLDGQTVTVKGPKGQLSWTVAEEIEVKQENGELTLSKRGEGQRAQAMWGLSRSLVANMVTGVTTGFKKEMEIQGVGYRAAMAGNVLKLSLGYSHEVNFDVPKGVTITAPKQTEIVVEGIDQQQVGQVAANIREWRAPEPYKGKGIRYKDEYIFRKEGKKK
jgi:large subunit ribosomal protein L6